jgi:hypothetical protein
MVDALGSLLKGAGVNSNLLASMGIGSGTEAIVDARMVSVRCFCLLDGR